MNIHLFRCLCRLNRSVVYQFSSPTNLEPVHLPFRVQILQLAVSQTHFVALTSGNCFRYSSNNIFTF